jgi:hypothetical protein
VNSLSRLEAVLDEEVLAREIAVLEASLPVGVRPRQLRIRTFLLGVACCLYDGRPAHLVRVHNGRRSAVERSNSRIKDPATIDVEKGWCRVMGLVTPTVFLAVALVVRNLALVDAFEKRQAENALRGAAGLPPKTRRRRRKSLAALAGANAPP